MVRGGPTPPGGAGTATLVLEREDVARSLRRIAHEILERDRAGASPVIVGIHTRGVPLASRLGRLATEFAGRAVPVGSLDVARYRDDRDLRPREPRGATALPAPIDGAFIVLVDDVLYTGRTVRAALEALADLGRPAAVELAVLVDRGHREFPIRPDFVGKNLPTSRRERVTVRVDEVDGDEGVWLEDPGEGGGAGG